MNARHLLNSIPWTLLSRSLLRNRVQREALTSCKFTAPLSTSCIRIRRKSIQTDVKNEKFSEFGDPNTFGTLSKTPRVAESLAEESIDPGDKREDEYLSYTDLDRKSTKAYGEEIKELVKQRKLKEALYKMEVEMKEKKVKPDEHIYGLLIGACGRTGYSKKAFSLYNDMKKRGLETGEGVITALFNSCANSPWNSEGLQRATKFRNQLKEKMTLFNRLQYHAMIKAFGRCGDFETALKILKEMASVKIIPTAESYSFLLQACVSNKTTGFENALKVWRLLRANRVTPDIFLYNLMLRVVRDCGIKENADLKSLISLGETPQPQITAGSELKSGLPSAEMRNNLPSALPNLLAPRVNVSSDLVTITSLEQPKNRLALLGGLEGFLEQMKNDHVTPDIKTYSQLLESMSSTHALETILLKHMKDHNVQPDIGFFNTLIKKRQYRGDSTAAKQVLALIRSHNLFPDIATYGVLALGCKYQKDAEEFIETMDRTGFRMNMEIFGSLLKNAVQIKDFYYILYLMNRVTAEWNLPFDEKHLVLLENFREKCRENILKSERGQEVRPLYSTEKFRQGYKLFEINYERWLSQLPAELPTHPWQQFRYKLEEKASE